MALGQTKYGFSFTSYISGFYIDSGRELFLLAAANTAELFQNKAMRMKHGSKDGLKSCCLFLPLWCSFPSTLCSFTVTTVSRVSLSDHHKPVKIVSWKTGRITKDFSTSYINFWSKLNYCWKNSLNLLSWFRISVHLVMIWNNQKRSFKTVGILTWLKKN